MSTGARRVSAAPDGEVWRARVASLKDPDFRRILAQEIVVDREPNGDDGGFNPAAKGALLREPSRGRRGGTSAFDRAHDAFGAVEAAWYLVEGTRSRPPICR